MIHEQREVYFQNKRVRDEEQHEHLRENAALLRKRKK